MKVAVIGASDKPERYSYKAVMRLKEHGHEVYPVHRRIKSIEGMPVYPSMDAIPGDIDTVSLYVNAGISDAMADSILAKQPRRIMFNPGAENPQLAAQARASGIETLNACTLVMLQTQQF